MDINRLFPSRFSYIDLCFGSGVEAQQTDAEQALEPPNPTAALQHVQQQSDIEKQALVLENEANQLLTGLHRE